MDIIPLVDIVMVTYNQEQYVAQAIESVLMQKTTFPFRLLIGEDCSTDRTLEICMNYANRFPDKILLNKNVTNLGLVKNYKKQFDACTAKYIAILEGDDYWHNENKLQKQIDFLELNADYGLVYTEAHILNEDGTLFENVNKTTKLSTPEGLIYDHILHANCITAVTTCFRKTLIDKFVDFDVFLKENFITIDLPLWLSITKFTKVKYLSESTATYRILNNSISNSNDYLKIKKFSAGGFEIRRYFMNYYKSVNPNIEQNYLIALLMLAIKYNDYNGIEEIKARIKKNNLKIIFLCFVSSNKMLLQIAKKINFFN